MAIDSRDKRSSAIGVSLPWRGMLPVPDGSLDQGDRQQVALVYRGVLAGSGTPPTPDIPFAKSIDCVSQRRRISATSERRQIAATSQRRRIIADTGD